MNKQSTDEELVRNFLSTGQQNYFEQLYKRYCGKVYRKCLYFTNDKLQADDLTQDIFLRLLHKLEGYKHEAKFSTWLYSITYNYCADQLRQLKSRQPTLPLDDCDTLSNAEQDETAYYDESVIDQIQQAILRLAPLEQHLIQKKYQEDMSIRELAFHYSLTENAVKMRLKRSRDRLRQYYQEETNS
ncbi:RNA polymerase sigma factor [Spirosoma gilvum]